MKLRRDLSILLVTFLILCVLPIFLHGNIYIMQILIMCLIWAVVAASWDLILGFAGIFTFGQVAFFVVGAYTSAILTSVLNISPWLGLILGGTVSGLLGILVALPCLKLKGPYVALVTFAFHMILEPLLKSDAGRSIGTGGTAGILTIPSLEIGGYTFSIFEPVPWFYAAAVLAFASLYVIYRIIHSNWGLAFVAVRDSETFARSLGVNDFKYKLMVFAISSFLTGVMGAFYAHYIGVLSTRILGLDLFLILLVMLVLGGIGRFPGAVIGAFIATIISELLRPLETYRGLIFGATVVLLIILMPKGIAGMFFPVKGKGILEKIHTFYTRRFSKNTLSEKQV
jgi:branched-chain amino acid transport system permease protein